VAVVLVSALLSVGVIVVAARWAFDTSFPGTKTVRTQQWAPEIGNLTFSATVASENEVVLNLTFSGTAYVGYPGFNWTLWISRDFVGELHETPLPEGLELVEGVLKANGLCPFPSNLLSLQVRLRAVTDGEWTVYGHFSATYGSGWYVGSSTGGIQISVSNGGIVGVEEAPYPTGPSTEQPSNSTEQPNQPPIHSTNP